MTVHNIDIATIFNDIADLLEIKGENVFRIRAYRNAARTVGDLSRNVSEIIEAGEDLTDLPGIGKDLAAKITEIAKTGKLSFLRQLHKEIPQGLSSVMDIPGLGPKKAKVLYQQLGIESVTDLTKAVKSRKIRGLPGFGAKTEESIRGAIDRFKGTRDRLKLSVAEEFVKPIVKYLKEDSTIKDIEVAGSIRRRKDTVKDADILVTCKRGSRVMERFIKYEYVHKVISKGSTRSSVLLRSGFQVDLRLVPEESFGAALHYFTGSKEHNIAIRTIGVKNKLKVNEYGVFRGKKRVAGKTEEEVYKAVHLPYIAPELRENRGEIEAARERALPALITLEDIRGDLHAHTDRTDGRNSLREMVEAARERKYEYIAVTDHTKHVTVAGGLQPKEVLSQIKEIDRLNAKIRNFTVLKSTEVDILEDGSLDLPEEVLKELDFTVCSVHYKFNLSKQKQTDRIIRAMDNKYFTIWGHPTGRLINERPAYEIDMERVMKKAKENGVILELNAHPDRLDLNDIHCKMAKDNGLTVAIATDAHSIHDLDFMNYGIGQARRGWLEKKDVVNTRGIDELRKFLNK